MSKKMYTALRQYADRYVRLSEEEQELFLSKVVLQRYGKKEHLLRPGQVCSNKYFILSGLVRMFYIDHKGQEKITQFAIENWWVTDMESFILGQTSELYIQAIEDTEVLAISKIDLEALYQTMPKSERLFRLITERMLIAMQRKNDRYMQMSSKERYLSLIEQFPDFAQRVPQYMIASYLEITPEYLSHLRRAHTRS